MNNFHQVLKELRKKHGLTQQQLADELGVNRVNVTRWEKGNTEPNLTQLTDIAFYFNVSVGFLMGIQNENIQKNVFNMFPEDIVEMSEEEQNTLEKSILDIIFNGILNAKRQNRSKEELISYVQQIEDTPFNTDKIYEFINTVYDTNSTPKDTNETNLD